MIEKNIYHNKIKPFIYCYKCSFYKFCTNVLQLSKWIALF